MIVIGGCHGSGNHAVSSALVSLGISIPGPHNNAYINQQTASLCWDILLDLTGNGMGSIVPSYEDLLAYDAGVVDAVPDINWCNPRYPAVAPVLRKRADGFVLIRRNMDNLLNSSMKGDPYFPCSHRHLVEAYNDRVARTSKEFEVPLLETWYEDWYKNRDTGKVREVVQFCNPTLSPTDEEIARALNRLYRPRNF